MYYAAVFIPTKEGVYAILFPDIPEAFTQGDTLEVGLDMAKEVLALTLEEYARVRKPLPEPSSLEDVESAMQAEMQSEGVDGSRKPLMQFVRASGPDLSPVRLNISMTRGALGDIDARAGASA